MDNNHWILIILWLVYYTLHSMLASTTVKEFSKKKLGKFYRFYRLAYSAFAFFTLIALLLYQYSFQSPILIKSAGIKYLAAFFLVLPGFIIMLISIKKYFLLLSGIRSIFTPVATPELKTSGIHKFVRHPLYSGTLLFVSGMFFIFSTLSNLIAATLLILYVWVGIIFEEKKLRKEFGKSYIEYITKVPKLVPSFKKQRT